MTSFVVRVLSLQSTNLFPNSYNMFWIILRQKSIEEYGSLLLVCRQGIGVGIAAHLPKSERVTQRLSLVARTQILAHMKAATTSISGEHSSTG